MELEKMVFDFWDLWQRLANYDVDIVFGDEVVHSIYDPVEIYWNHDGETTSFSLP